MKTCMTCFKYNFRGNPIMSKCERCGRVSCELCGRNEDNWGVSLCVRFFPIYTLIIKDQDEIPLWKLAWLVSNTIIVTACKLKKAYPLNNSVGMKNGVRLSWVYSMCTRKFPYEQTLSILWKSIKSIERINCNELVLPGRLWCLYVLWFKIC